MERKSIKVNQPRLSPNEEAQFVREELERRRKLRVQQVREQERYISRHVRCEVRERKEKELQNLAAALQHEWLEQQGDKIQTLEKLLEDSLRAVGQGYRSAKLNEPDRDAVVQRREENKKRAAERHQQALQTLACQKQNKEDQCNRHVEARKKVLIVEKERALKVARRPHSVPNPIESIEIQKVSPPRNANMDNFSITYCHTPETVVHRGTGIEKLDAYQAAMLEAQRLEALATEGKLDKQDQLEKAQLRGGHALRKEKDIQVSARMLCALKQLKQVDLQQRRHVVNSIPAQIFQPLYRHDELRAEHQRELEIAFQNLYCAEREVRGDLAFQPLETLSTASAGGNDEGLDVTLEPEAIPCEEEPEEEETAASPCQSAVVRGDLALQPLEPLTTASAGGNDEGLDVTLEPEAIPCEKEPEGEETAAPPSQSAVNSTLSRLLDRIRNQRVQCSQQEFPTAQGRTVLHNSGIETGPLNDQEWEKAPSLEEEISNASHAGTDCKVTVESTGDGSMLQADEQMERKGELSRLHQQQHYLLQQLEENRHFLELQTQKTQQYRQKVHKALQVGVISSSSESLPTPHLFSYQQSLLKQNRLHKNCIEDARWQLEEYKKTLKLRYSAVPLMTSQTHLPTKETICSMPSSADGEYTSACTQVLVSDIGCPIPHATSSVNNPQIHHKIPPTEFKILTDPALISQPSLHTESVASNPHHSMLSPTITTYVPSKVLIPDSVNPECLLLNLPQSQTSTLTTTSVLPNVSMTLIPPLGDRFLSDKRYEDGDSKLRDVKQAYLQTTHMDAISSKCFDPLVVKTPGMTAGSGQTAVIPGQEKGAQGFEFERDQMMKQLQVGVEYTKAIDYMNGLLPHSASLSENHDHPLLQSKELLVSKSESGGPPRTLKVLFQEQHQLSTIQELETSANVSLDTAGTEMCLGRSAECSDLSVSSSVSESPPTAGSAGSQGPSSGSEVFQSENSTCRLSWRGLLQLESADSCADTFQPLSPEVTYSHLEACSLEMSMEQLHISNDFHHKSEHVMSPAPADNSLKLAPPCIPTPEPKHSASETCLEMSSDFQLFRGLPQQSYR